MATVRDIRRRINSIRNIRQITKAMNMIASAKLARAQTRLSSFTPYAQILDGIVKNLIVRCERRSHPLLAKREPKIPLLVVITSDRGLCGAFNANVIEAGARLIEKTDLSTKLILIGKKGITYLGRGGYEIEEASRTPDPPDIKFSSSIAEKISTSYGRGECDQVHLLFNEFISITKQTIKQLKLLPIEAERPKGYITDYLYEPIKESVLNSLLPHYLEVQLHWAILESIAAEHAARMLAMDNATKNAGEMIDNLVLSFNKARQAMITKEMIEISTSLEAIAQAAG